MPLILDGRRVAAQLRDELHGELLELQRAHGLTPRLAVVRAGEDPASVWYARAIERACRQVGIAFELRQLAADAPQALIEQEIATLNADPATHGIMVQMPLPAGIDAQAVITALDPRKDVDGQHPLNLGRLLQGVPALLPNTPAGGLELLRRYDIPIAGRRAVVVGRSTVVGKPLALLLLQEHATVTIAHSRTPELAALTREADILAVAVGRPGLITGAMIKPGATVLDFGINETADGQVVGDVDDASAAEVAGAITPVPGGTGPVTNMLLLRNVLQAARLQLG
ncbi:bifunctional 5,10-methylenetetrahydrofolate dehydrogenase/5,10-methenyltetrahydrofolate cyclohydrolase [Kallotenue papyrolyticum]|uniref:bifunctional 5,10-methylenetetrahydrofolate dehydrogenase/5,10-methenyltetrahydrofolate cyclohydrolase n=1 Tax=Kallotenue papyrolyticum TaxID=1325125 RepID=UPI000478552E|nr:bifunctional 5,10-methylenetetrahydrofolate dehydrogenase/5,10-methenyltetrahydrofolate cyclohydrolase [Kallotenue papyrolyticum]